MPLWAIGRPSSKGSRARRSQSRGTCLEAELIVHTESAEAGQARRPDDRTASGRTEAISAAVALVLVVLAAAAPMQSEQPLVQAAIAAPLEAIDGWEGLAGWREPLRESGLIAFVGSALLAAAGFVRRTKS